MTTETLKSEESERKRYLKNYIIFILIVSIVLILIRIIFYLFENELSDFFIFDLLITNRDQNFKTNYDLMSAGIFDYYQYNPLIDEYGIYLYFWYFLFFPFYILPYEISIYVWDLFRLFSAIYVAVQIKNLNLKKRELTFFVAFSSIGYLADMYLNNTNWLIQLFVFESYIYLEKERKLLSGFFFTLATFKVILIIFPFILTIIKRIKFKDLFYYFLPFIILSIPYIIFPNYLLSMISNWFKSTEYNSGSVILYIFFITWRFIQPAHLMFISIILLIIISNIKNEKLRNKVSFLLYGFTFIFWIVIWLILFEFAFFF